MLSKEEFGRIYGMLDRVDPVAYDCGMSCGAICCRNDSFRNGMDPCIYLLPGEKEYLESAGAGIKIKKESRKEHGLPPSYGKYVYVAYCNGSDSCNRRCRPIQCRSFPLWPHITSEGELVLTYYDGELPYVCPLIEKNQELSAEFVKTTYEAWEMLTEDKAVRDLIRMDS